MSSLAARVAKLEKRRGGLSFDAVVKYMYREEDGEEGKAIAEAEAIEKWEAENGSLEDRSVLVIARCIVSPRQSENAAYDVCA